MRQTLLTIAAAFSMLCAGNSPLAAADDAKPIRVGIVGLDTSHVTAFTSAFNNPKAKPELSGIRVVAAYPFGSKDIASSRDRIPKYTSEMREKFGVEIVDSLPALLDKVDAILLETNDGQPRLEEVKTIFKAGKPVFMDKPAAATLVDLVRIYDLAEKSGVPCFSASSLRFNPATVKLKDNPAVGEILGCVAYSPSELEPHHVDLFWYGIHGVESLFTVMGPGCETVTRTQVPEGELVTGVWKGGRIGTFRGMRSGKLGYGTLVFGSKGIVYNDGYGGYEPLAVEIAKLFKTRKPPITAADTIELYAFMEAADESKRRGGAPVKLADVLAKARAEAAGSR